MHVMCVLRHLGNVAVLRGTNAFTPLINLVINCTHVTCVIKLLLSKDISQDINAFTLVINRTSVTHAAKHLGTPAHSRTTSVFTLVINLTSVTCVVRRLLGALISTYINGFTLEEHTSVKP